MRSMLIALLLFIACCMPTVSLGQMFAGYDEFCGVRVIVTPNPQDAAASMDQYGPVIYVDPKVMANMTYSRVFSIAHECGHIKLGHMTPSGMWFRNTQNWATKKQELEADCWAVKVLENRGYYDDITRTAGDFQRQGPFNPGPYPSGTERLANLMSCLSHRPSESPVFKNEDPLVKECLLVETPDNGIHWNTSASSPNVSYNLLLRNNCQCRLRGKFHVITGIVPRNSQPGDNSEWVQFQLKAHDFEIASGAMRHISGTLHWTIPSDDVMPRIRYAEPPRRDVELITLNDSPAGCVSENYITDYCKAFKKIMAVGSQSLTALRESVVIEEDDLTRKYKSKINIDGFPQGHVTIYKDDPSDATVNFGRRSQDQQELKQAYDNLVASARQCFQEENWQIDERSDGEKKRLSIRSENLVGHMTVSQSKMTVHNTVTYTLGITIYPQSK